jgi:DNA invertase Pin-like site-specific DNA recombinase
MTGKPRDPLRAVQYVRMSTEHQRYSIAYQSACNQAYALERGYQLVRSYTDAGVSGLTLARRDGLKALLADVVSGHADFQLILVYDVSRWGRFQDPDESAHYEFICRTAGVSVAYCAEPFANDGSLTSTLVKHLKRAMAAEYSRELSAKVSRAKRGLIGEGYWCGSVPVYGFRRCVLTPEGTPGEVLQAGERKALQGRRVVLVAGPPEEIAVVRRIFREFVIEGLSARSISARLNAEGEAAGRGGVWTAGKVRRVLDDEKYAGVLVGGRRVTTLRKDRPLPREQWIRAPDACPALVDPELAALARANLRRALRAGTDESLIAALRRTLALHGRLSARVMRDTPGCCSPSIYCRRFGSLTNAYRLAGYTLSPVQASTSARMSRAATLPPGRLPFMLSDDELLVRLRALHDRCGRLTSAGIDEDPALPSAIYVRSRFGDMLEVCARVGVSPRQRQRAACVANRRRRAGGRPVRLVTVDLAPEALGPPPAPSP